MTDEPRNQPPAKPTNIEVEESMTAAERRAIFALEKLKRTWPKSLWIFAADSHLVIMKKKGGRKAINSSGGMDHDYIVATVGIEADGGDWF